MMRNKSFLWALAVVTIANAGCRTGGFRNWLHRGSPCTPTCGTVMASPVALGAPMQAPQVAPTMAPVMAPAPMQQYVMPQQQPVVCCPQPVPCCPQPIPCCPPMQYDPCQGGYMSGGYMEGGYMGECGPLTTFDEGYLIPGSETPVDSDADPRPATED